jgi:hypothetical protein
VPQNTLESPITFQPRDAPCCGVRPSHGDSRRNHIHLLAQQRAPRPSPPACAPGALAIRAGARGVLSDRGWCENPLFVAENTCLCCAPQPCSKPGNHAARKLSVELQLQHLRYGGGVAVTGMDRRQNGIVLGLGTSRFHRRQASRSLVGEARAYWRRKTVKSEANQSTARGITCTFPR